MKQAKTSVWVGDRLVRQGDLLDDNDPLIKSHGELFAEAEALAVTAPPKVFTSESVENPPPRPAPEPGPQIMTAPERKKPGPKPGARRVGTPTDTEASNGGG